MEGAMVRARVEKIDENVEEAVTLSIDRVEIVCFAGVCPYAIKEGETYPVSVTLAIFGDYDLHESSDERPSLRQIGNSFSYVATGWLSDDVLDAGIKFVDEIFLSDYGYLNGKMVSMQVDRIDVEFLPA
jgi:hypothetical protein